MIVQNAIVSFRALVTWAKSKRMLCIQSAQKRVAHTCNVFAHVCAFISHRFRKHPNGRCSLFWCVYQTSYDVRKKKRTNTMLQEKIWHRSCVNQSGAFIPQPIIIVEKCIDDRKCENNADRNINSTKTKKLWITAIFFFVPSPLKMVSIPFKNPISKAKLIDKASSK